MLFLPLFDAGWRPPALPRSPRHYWAWTSLLIVIAALLVFHPSSLPFALATLLLVALPEEWFFRAYFMVRTGKGIQANIIASLLFSLIHGLTRDWMVAGLVFIPSMLYGWLYQRTGDLFLLILVHALSNLLFVLYLAAYVEEIYPGLL